MSSQRLNNGLVLHEVIWPGLEVVYLWKFNTPDNVPENHSVSTVRFNFAFVCTIPSSSVVIGIAKQLLCILIT